VTFGVPVIVARKIPRTTPILAARRLVDRPGLAVLASSENGSAQGRFSYVASDPDGTTDALDPFEGRPAAAAGFLAGVPRFIGIIPYEARRAALERPTWTPVDRRDPPRLGETWWARYPSVLAIDHATDEAWLVAETEGAARDMEKRLERAPSELAPFRFAVRETEDGDVHVSRVARAIELIRAGDLYQVNLARRLALQLSKTDGGAPAALEALAFFDALTAASPTPFGAFITIGASGFVASSSPELALDATSSAGGGTFDALVTEPIKGTRPRSRDRAADEQLAAELDADPKERAELAMIVDVERNDLARVSRRGTVEVTGAPRVVGYRTVHHRVATVRGRARADASRAEVLEAMVPSGSVTGAPKIRAMEVIAELEAARRGLYTGAFGYAGHDGSMRLAMAIRTAVFGPDGRGEYGVGGGIVVDSDPARELEETRWKSVQLERIMEGAGR
jgi:anthranilate/para-aminobenzoate synthase component I